MASFLILSWLESLGEHEAFAAEAESRLMRLEFSLNPANKEVLGLCDIFIHNEFGGKGEVDLETSWELGNFESVPDNVGWSSSCQNPKSIMKSVAGTTISYMYVGISEDTEVRSLSLKAAFMVENDIQLTSFAIPKVTIYSCTRVGQAEMCTIARTMTFTHQDSVLNLVQWVTDPEEDCATTVIKGVTQEVVEALHHAFKAETEHGSSDDALMLLGDKQSDLNEFVSDHDESEHDESEHETIPNAGWYLYCICAKREYAATEGCRELAEEHTLALVKHWGLSALVHFMTSLLKKAVRWSVFKSTFPRTRTERFVYSLIGIFVAEYVFSGFILFITTARVFPAVPAYMSTITGENGDFGAKWYSTTGSNLLTFSMIYVFYPHALQLITAPWNYLKTWHKARRETELDGLINAYKQKDFKLDNRLATVVSLACVVMTYSAPLPLMLVFGACGLGLAYWCDKAQILWNSCKPTALRYQVVLTGCVLLQVGVIFHCCVAIGTFGHPLVFPSRMFPGVRNQFLDKLIHDARTGNSILSYMSVDPGAIIDRDWTGPRLQTFFYAKTSFPYFLILFIIAAIFTFAIFFMRVLVHTLRSEQKRTKIVDRLYTLFFPRVSVPKVTRTYEDLIPIIENRGGVRSYFWGDNPAYKEVFECIWSSKTRSNAFVTRDCQTRD